jgi:4-amino-4-deoxy-L-arabinose transferase-like glycosyltransferase
LITRLACTIFAVALVATGIAEPSLAVVALAAATFGLALTGVGGLQSWRTFRAKRGPCWTWQSFGTRSLALAGAAAGLGFVTVALGSVDSLVALPVLTWVLAIGALIALGLHLDRLTLREAFAAIRALGAERHRSEVGSVLAIAGVAMILRFYDLETIPPAVHGDEGEMGKIVMSILNGDTIPFFKTAPFWGPTYPFNYVQALVVWLFGASVASLRTVSVLAGVLCVVLVYCLGRIGWGPVVGALAAWLMTVSHMNIHYSRLAQIFMASTFTMTATMLLLFLAAQQACRQAARRSREGAPAFAAAAGPAAGSGEESAADRQRFGPADRGVWTFLIAAGAMAGFAQHIYHATRVVPIVAAPLLVYLWYRRWITRWHIVAFGFAFLVVYAPLLAWYIDSPGDFYVRMSEVSAFQNWYVRDIIGKEYSLPTALPLLIGEQIRRSLGLFIKRGDFSGFYTGSLPTFDVVTAALIWLGLGAAASRIWRFHELAVLTWFAIGLFFGSVVTLGAENGHRILIMTPAAFLLGGIALARAKDVLDATSLRRYGWLAAPLGTTLALWLLAANVAMYFYEYVPRDENAESTLMAREMRVAPEQYRYYFLTDPRFDPNHGSVRYVAYGIDADNLKSADDFKPPTDGRGVLIFALEHRLADLKTIEARLPGGEETRVNAPNGRLLYVQYRLPPTR